MNCGCGMPYEKHGIPTNLDANDLQRAAAANGQSLEETVRNISETADALMVSGGGPGLAHPVTGSARGK
jgi:hypothetical protein